MNSYKCLKCGREFKAITNTHLMKCSGLTIASYLSEYQLKPGQIKPIRTYSAEVKRKMSESRKGKPKSEEWRRRIGQAKTGVKRKPFSEEWKRKISESVSGKNNPFYGKNHSAETKKYLRECQMGEKSHAWKGGVSYAPYTYDWWVISYQIRKRDNWECQICRARFSPKQRGFLKVHHINYEKQDNRSDNLISLCPKCHGKTHYNRNYWKGYFAFVKLIKENSSNDYIFQRRIPILYTTGN